MQKYYFNTITKYSLILGLILAVASCNAIFENDITKDKVNLVLPQNGQVFSTNKVNFKWQELDGVTNYRLEIVSPSFSNLQNFVLDSLISGNDYSYILPPGNYQFQLRGENSGYQSLYTGPYSITIDSVSDLTNQLVSLSGPSVNYNINNTNIVCNWSALYAAEKYEFQLKPDSNFESSTSVSLIKHDIYSNAYTIPQTNLSEGEYSWGIKAHNQNSSSGFSYRNFTIDLTNPNDVSLLTPLDGITAATQTVVFKWNSGVDSGIAQSPVSTSIEISTDSMFTTLYDAGNAEFSNITSDSLEVDFAVGDEYWWRVLAVDEAGNESDNYSDKRKITIP
mgnify:CR=1 FL=1